MVKGDRTTSWLEYAQPAVMALVGWLALSVCMFFGHYPWYAYALAGIFLLCASYGWHWVIRHQRMTPMAAIAFGCASAIILIASLGMYLLL